MRNIGIIAWKEFRQYFGSPIAYFLAVVIFLFLGIVFALDLVQTMSNTYSAQVLEGTVVLGPLLTLVLFATPAITMKLLAEESGQGTLELLLTAPVRDSELVIGKWCGAALFAAVILALTWIYPIFLQAITKPNGIDQGPLVSSYIVLFLLVGALLAVGVGDLVPVFERDGGLLRLAGRQPRACGFRAWPPAPSATWAAWAARRCGARSCNTWISPPTSTTPRTPAAWI